MRSLVRVGSVALALIATAVAWPATADPAAPRTTLADGPVGAIAFNSYTPASQRPLLTRGHLGGPVAVVGGSLSLPAPAADGRFPAVILAHGIGGISAEREGAWARRLNEWGIAAFILDSFTGRGLTPPVYAGAQRATHVAAHLVDAYLALQLLATHPRIDRSRVALMGFSRGGETAVNAIFEPFRQGALGGAGDRFAAYVALYPYCNFRHASRSLATAPMLMLLGGADEMTEPGPCTSLATSLEQRGVPVRTVVYPGAHHGFDRQAPVVFDANFVGVRGCEAEYDLDRMTIRRLDTGAVLATREANEAWVAECRKRGARFGGDAAAREASIGEVRQFLARALARP
jgi:dienelactone hydrolase